MYIYLNNNNKTFIKQTDVPKIVSIEPQKNIYII